MKKLLLLLLLALPLGAAAQSHGDAAQSHGDDDARYLAGAVPTEDGLVYFSKTYQVPGKSKAELFQLLRDYTQKEIIGGPNHLDQSRLTQADTAAGLLVASMEEMLYFKKKAWVTHGTRFFYQLIYRVGDGTFTVDMRRIHYLYEETEVPGITTAYPAEKWITDEEALNKSKTKLTRIAGKFRRFTIDRKDEIFRGAGRAAGAIKRVTRVVEVEE